MKLQVFDPPMCCSSGVCGPSVDPELVRFAADLEWLARQGVEIERYNLAQQPAAFAGTQVVKEALGKDGNGCLPMVLVDGVVTCTGRYPTRLELAGYAGVAFHPSVLSEVVKELVAIGAAIGSNCEPCFKYHYNEARKLGVTKEDIRGAVDLAKAVKSKPARSISELVDKYLKDRTVAAPSGCCGPATDDLSPSGDKPKKGCC